MKWRKVDDLYWERECGRYTVQRSLAFDRLASGHWVYLAWFRPAQAVDEQYDALAVCLSPQRRDSFEEAVADCAPHIRAQQPQRPLAA